MSRVSKAGKVRQISKINKFHSSHHSETAENQREDPKSIQMEKKYHLQKNDNYID